MRQWFRRTSGEPHAGQAYWCVNILSAYERDEVNEVILKLPDLVNFCCRDKSWPAERAKSGSTASEAGIRSSDCCGYRWRAVAKRSSDVAY